MNQPDTDTSQNWRGIHMSRGMRLRLSNLSIGIGCDGNVHLSEPEVSVSIDLFAYWLEIGMEHLTEAENAHKQLLAVWGRDDDREGGQWLEKEFSTSLQCITASVIAIDAFYAMVFDHVEIPKETSDAWRTKRTSRPKQVAEVLKRGFIIKHDEFLVMRKFLINLFKWRDWSVHPPAGFKKPVSYAELSIGTEWRFVAFRFENARTALANSLRIIDQLLRCPKPRLSDLVEHCHDSLPLVELVVQLWRSKMGRLYEGGPPGGETSPPTVGGVCT